MSRLHGFHTLLWTWLTGAQEFEKELKEIKAAPKPTPKKRKR
jgi:hypothetical protein